VKKFFLISIFILISCTPQAKQKTGQPEIPFNPILNMTFGEAWGIVRDCMQENNLPIADMDKRSGFIKTEKLSDPLQKIKYSLNIEVNNIDEKNNKVYIKGTYVAVSPVFVDMAKRRLNDASDKLKICINEKRADFSSPTISN
jgi:hypothetical protein